VVSDKSLPSHYIPMDNSSTHHDPIYYDDSGCYITAPQLRFFLNRPGGRSKFINGMDEFIEYFHTCRTYNLISDLLEEDPECACMYWDSKLKSPVFSFSVKGKVAQKFAEAGIIPPNGDSYEV